MNEHAANKDREIETLKDRFRQSALQDYAQRLQTARVIPLDVILRQLEQHSLSIMPVTNVPVEPDYKAIEAEVSQKAADSYAGTHLARSGFAYGSDAMAILISLTTLLAGAYGTRDYRQKKRELAAALTEADSLPYMSP